MMKDTNAYIDTCQSCAENTGSLKSQVLILSYPVPREPWDTNATDLLKFTLTSEEHQYLLVAIDHFTKFLES